MSEELIVRHCSPTLAGLKTGNLFACSYDTLSSLRDEVRGLNRRLSGKGLRVLPLRAENGAALIYIYRPRRLEEDLSDREVSDLLRGFGYRCETVSGCLQRLQARLRTGSSFPHEIGLFLGYPPEDVRGFIEHNAKDCKCSGYWKVYGDAEQAKKRFARYKKCTDVYLRQLGRGNTLDRLAVTV